MANNDFPCEVTAATEEELRRTVDFYDGLGFRGQILFAVPGNVSKARYLKIREALEATNKSYCREDAIDFPRSGPEFKAPPSVTIRSVEEFNETLASHGTKFCCHIPKDVRFNIMEQIAHLASTNNVQRDTWTTD